MSCGCTDNKDLTNKIIRLEDMKNMSIDEIVDEYRKGYVPLGSTQQRYLETQTKSLNHKEIVSLVPLTCPSPTPSIPQGTSKNITVQVDTAGTPPYFYELLIDGAVKQRYPTTGTTTETSHIFSYNFPTETVGTHAVTTRLTDSCSSTPKVATSQCSVNITICTNPAISMTIQ